MKEQYKRELDLLRAPEPLIKTTQAAVRKKLRGGAAAVRWPGRRIAAAAAAFALFLFAGTAVWLAGPAGFTQVQANAPEKAPPITLGQFDPAQRSVTCEEFDENFGTRLADLAAEPLVCRAESGSGVLAFTWNRQGAQLQVRCMFNTGALPAFLEAAGETELGGVAVHLAESETHYYAGATCGPLTLLVEQERSGVFFSQRRFKNAVADLIERLPKT